ncbi:ester cyclase [Asticcacaulis machinosus]|uniref:Ester cyclase n=1 Tax=Asticcacaulis machinosus TaxID=2984211 RepID=A0ABT5HH46_9CAUL|nr:ester cyclase [Asticcacaulis machinosus]MDC7675574.1 ester cyclase [Asticcacaulis machinosus]
MTHAHTHIWTQWLALWNGDLKVASEIVAEDYILHMSPIGGGGLEAFAGPEGLASWVGMLHAALRPLQFTVQVEPLFDRDMIAGRWVAKGQYVGGFPGARAEPGTIIQFAGADFLRIRDAKIVEYWLSSDVLDLMQPLGITI